MTFSIPQPMLLDVAASAYASIATCAVAAADGRETGGVLLGHDPGGRVIYIRRAGDAGPAAVRKPDRFARDADHAQQLAEIAFAADRSLWIGEWHTHPNGFAQPSPTDLAAYVALLDDRGLGLVRFVAVIVTASPQQGWQSPVLTPWLIQQGGVLGMTLSVVTPAVLRRTDP